MSEYLSSFTGKRIDELLEIVNGRLNDKPLSISYGGTGVSSIEGMAKNLGVEEYGRNKILWEGASYMNNTQKYSFPEGSRPLDQPHGIVLVFSYYDNVNKVEKDCAWSTHFVPKTIIANEGFHTFLMACNYDGASVTFGAKQLYISNSEIGGHAWNDVNTTSGTEINSSNIAFRNGNYVLRYVIGV